MDKVRNIGNPRKAWLPHRFFPSFLSLYIFIYFFNLQPKAPVVTRACYFLECAHFVHQCNRGQWPTWLKMNLPVFRPSKGNNLNAQPMVQRRTQILQLQATKMFYQWAEVSQSVLIKYSIYTLCNSEGVIVVMTCSLDYLPTVRKNVRSAHSISETFQLSSIHASLQSMIPSFREFGLRSLAQH